MRIGELAHRTGVSVRSLRYYEEQGLLAPERTAAGHRIYRAEDEATVHRIRELFQAGFCSSVIQDLLPALAAPGNGPQLRAAFAAARARLESEKQAIDDELGELERLAASLGLAPDMHVTPQDGTHDSSEHTSAAPFDHRDRRLR